MAQDILNSSALSKSWFIWKTLTVGGVPKDELLKRLADGDFSVNDSAKDIMGKPAFTTSAEPKEVSFVRLKVIDFGFTVMPTTVRLFDRDRLAQFNLDLCESEDGPHIRPADVDQPRGTWYWIAMNPIIGSGGGPRVFDIERDVGGRRWLGARLARPDDYWYLGDRFVFRLRKRK